MNCGHCGNELSEGAKFCWSCGQAVRIQEGGPEQEGSQASEEAEGDAPTHDSEGEGWTGKAAQHEPDNPDDPVAPSASRGAPLEQTVERNRQRHARHVVALLSVVVALLLVLVGFQIAGAVNRQAARDRAMKCLSAAADESGEIFYGAFSGCIDAARLGLIDQDGLVITDEGGDGGFPFTDSFEP